MALVVAKTRMKMVMMSALQYFAQHSLVFSATEQDGRTCAGSVCIAVPPCLGPEGLYFIACANGVTDASIRQMR